MEGREQQVMKIPRSCGVGICEPCQSLAAAALSKTVYVPQGSFGGVNYCFSASVCYVEIRCVTRQYM